MTLRPHRDEPCWQIVYVSTGEPPQAEGGDGWPHYLKREAAESDLAEMQRDYDEPLTIAQSFPTPCVGLFCDGSDCDGEAIDVGGDEGWTHLDPSDPLPMDLSDLDVIERDGKHYCDACQIAMPWCDDCDEQHPEGDCDAASNPRLVPVSPDQIALPIAMTEATS